MLPLERSFFNRRRQREIPANSESGHNSETKDTFFSQTFKVEENKVPLFFFNFGSVAEIKSFSKHLDGTLLMWLTKNEKMAISQPQSQN